MIRREDVADLRAGDIVSLSGHPEMHGATVTGPLYATSTGRLDVGGWIVRWQDREPNKTYRDRMTLTVISRAKPPLYVNSDKTDPDPGDVAKDCDGDIWAHRYGDWHAAVPEDESGDLGPEHFKPLTLLVDGRTGLTVPDAS